MYIVLTVAGYAIERYPWSDIVCEADSALYRTGTQCGAKDTEVRACQCEYDPDVWVQEPDIVDTSIRTRSGGVTRENRRTAISDTAQAHPDT